MQLLFNTIMLEINRWTKHHRITVPLIDLLKQLEEVNFKTLEIWQYHLSSLSIYEVEQLKEKLNSLNMITSVVGLYLPLHLSGNKAKETGSLVDRIIAFTSLLDATTIKILPGILPSASVDLPIWRLSIKRLKNLANKLADKGIELSMETHGNTLCDTKESTFRLLNDLSKMDNVGICWQPFDEQNTEQAMRTFTEMLPRIIHIHLQNLSDRNAETTTFLETGGWMDYKRLLPHIKKSGFNNIFCLEFTEGIFPQEREIFNPQTVIDNAIKDREFFTQWFSI